MRGREQALREFERTHYTGGSSHYICGWIDGKSCFSRTCYQHLPFSVKPTGGVRFSERGCVARMGNGNCWNGGVLYSAGDGCPEIQIAGRCVFCARILEQRVRSCFTEASNE